MRSTPFHNGCGEESPHSFRRHRPRRQKQRSADGFGTICFFFLPQTTATERLPRLSTLAKESQKQRRWNILDAEAVVGVRHVRGGIWMTTIERQARYGCRLIGNSILVRVLVKESTSPFFIIRPKRSSSSAKLIYEIEVVLGLGRLTSIHALVKEKKQGGWFMQLRWFYGLVHRF